MSDPQTDLNELIIEMGVAIAIGAAGLEMSGEATPEMTEQMRALWPDELSADAFEIAKQAAIALSSWVRMSDTIIGQPSGHDLLALSQSLMPSPTEGNEN